jgi:hypothetical protein
MTLLSILLLSACHGEPAWCRDRADDADCDGVPDAQDRCAETEAASLTDRVGCSENQAAGCTVALASPEDGASEVTAFRWTGTCDVYLLQFSDDPAFPPGSTRTAARSTALAVSASGTEKYWRVQGGRTGSSSGYSTAPRELGW